MPGITTICRWLFSALLIGLLLSTSSLVKVLASSNDYSDGFLSQNAGDNPGCLQEQDADNAVDDGSAHMWPELTPAADSEQHAFVQAPPQDLNTHPFNTFTFTGGFDGFDGFNAYSNFDFSMTQSSDQQYHDVALDTLNHRITEASELWASEQQAPVHWQTTASEDHNVPYQPPEPPHVVLDIHDTQFHFNGLPYVPQEPVTEAGQRWVYYEQVPLHGQSSTNDNHPQQPQEPLRVVQDIHDTQFHFNELPFSQHEPVTEAGEHWAYDQQVPLQGQSSTGDHHYIPQQPQEPPQDHVLQGMHDIQLHFNELPYSESHQWLHEAPAAPPTRLNPDYSNIHSSGPYQNLRRRRSPSPPLTSSAQEGRPPKRMRTLAEESNEPGPGPVYLNDPRLPYDGHVLDTRWRTILQSADPPVIGGRVAPEQGTHSDWETRAQGGITHPGQQHQPPAQAQVQQAQASIDLLYRGRHGFGLPSNSLLEELQRLFQAINSGQGILSATHNEWIGRAERQHRANFLADAVDVADEVIRETLPLSHPLQQAFLNGNQDTIAARLTDLLAHDRFAHILSPDASDTSPAEQVQQWREDRNSALSASSAQLVELPAFGIPVRPDAHGRYALPGQEERTLHPTLERSIPGMICLHFVSPLVGNMVERLLSLFPLDFVRGYRSFESRHSSLPTLGLGWITLATVLLRQALMRRLPGYGIGYWMLLPEAEKKVEIALTIEEQFLWRTPVLEWIAQTDEYYSILRFLSSLRTRVRSATTKTEKLEGQSRRYPQIYHPTGHTGLLRGPPGTFSRDAQPEAGPSQPCQRRGVSGGEIDSEATGSKPTRKRTRKSKPASSVKSSGPFFENQNECIGKGKGKATEDAPPQAEDENGEDDDDGTDGKN